MKVLLVSSWYPPVQSGSSFWAESLVAGLRRRGHDVRVVTTVWKGMEKKPERSREERIYYLPAKILPRNRFLLGLSIVPISYSIANRRRMLEIVQDFKPDVIHQINHIFDTVLLSAYAARKTGTPLVGSITTPLQSNSIVIQSLMHFADVAGVYHFGVRFWQRIICSDSTQAQYAKDTYGSRANDRIVTHIHVGVHDRIYNATPERRSSDPYIVMVGHVHEIRDPTNVIRAMPIILAKIPEARLDIAGRIQLDNPVQEVKRLGLESAVNFLGEVSQEKVCELVSRAQVFALLHQCKYAGLSFTAVEAMQFETPVIINADENLYGPDVIKDGENIVLVDVNDVQEIALKLICLLEDKRLRKRIGKNGKNFVASYLSWEMCAEKTEQLYEELI